MTITFYPFGAGAGSGINEAEWSELARYFRATGVIGGGLGLDDLEGFADSTGMQVKVRTGIAILEGHFLKSTDIETLPITTADGSNPRIDLIVARVDWVNNLCELDIVDGAASASPSPPALTRTSSVYEIQLAEVYVDTSVSTIDAGDITDTREWSVEGPLVERVSITVILQEDAVPVIIPEMPTNFTITGVRLEGDQSSGSAEIDILVGAFGGSRSSICASDLPALSSAKTLDKTSFSGWTLSITKGQAFEVELTGSLTTHTILYATIIGEKDVTNV
ncbi:MAG: hypothetical protein JRE40_00005 [Deltaproteobacteria bacterium]|nr:hypothetical protein [Deltaproteobacteria bacterium]